MQLAKTPSRLFLVLTLAISFLSAGAASAGITLESKDGWSLTIGGMINAFAVDEMGDATPHADLYSRTTGDNGFRVRSGLIPGLIGFSVGAPEVGGIKAAGRIGFWPGANGLSGARTTINGANIDVREFNLTVAGGFGEVLVGRALGLFQGKNILTDMSLFGVGVSGPFENGPTLGHIGIGYLYTSFDAQLRYTTPDLSGAKLALAIVDPASVAAGAVTTAPTFEGELSYSGKSDALSYQAWASFTYQSSRMPAAGSSSSYSLTSTGGAGGVGVGVSGLDLLLSGFFGSGIGTTGVINSANTVDSAGKARATFGFLGQATYTLGKVKLGANFSRLAVSKTDQDRSELAAQLPSALGLLDSRQALTAGVWYELVPAIVKLVVEGTNARLKFADGSAGTSNTLSCGAFLFF
jgi:hypothetical protein